MSIFTTSGRLKGNPCDTSVIVACMKKVFFCNKEGLNPKENETTTQLVLGNGSPLHQYMTTA